MASGRCAARRRWSTCLSCQRILRRAGRGCGPLVANDYRIEVAQQHPFFDALRNQFTPRNVPFETRVRAAGEVRDFSNRRAVEFEHGFATGQTIFGFDAAGHVCRLEGARRIPAQPALP